MEYREKTIKEILGEKYMEKFRIFHEQTLFPPAWENLKEKRCPLCYNLLKKPLNKEIVYCRGVKHKKPFTMTFKKFKELSSKYE